MFKPNFCKVFTALSVALLTQQVHAAAFNLNEHSASGLGRAFAGEGAIADNAAVLSRNPAAMTLFKRMEVSVAGSYVKPNIDLQGREGIPALGISQNQLDANDIAPSAFVPAAYFIQPINDKWAWGLGLFTNYGLSTEFADNYAAGLIGGKTELTTINFNPNLAYRINDQWSIGGGISAIYADATLIRRAGATSPKAPGTEMVNLSGDTWDWGWNIGTLFELNDANRWSLTYRSGTTLNFEGDFTGKAAGVQSVSPLAFKTVTGNLDLELPAIAEFSGYHLLNPKVAVHYSVQWTDWSVLKELRATSSGCNDGTAGQCFKKDEDFSDSLRYAIGTSYYVNDKWTLRAGIALDQQAAHDVISIPDTERLWYSLGTSYQFTPAFGVDLGLAYLDGKDVQIDEELAAGLPTAKYTSSASAFLAAAQANYRF
ncbi:MAG: outer membrane protein transport protein [Aeromonadaceae bacterium]